MRFIHFCIGKRGNSAWFLWSLHNARLFLKGSVVEKIVSKWIIFLFFNLLIANTLLTINFANQGAQRGALKIHPDRQHFIYPLGCTVVIEQIPSTTTPGGKPESGQRNQQFLSGHSNAITCIAISKSGRYIASGQVHIQTYFLLQLFLLGNSLLDHRILMCYVQSSSRYYIISVSNSNFDFYI